MGNCIAEKGMPSYQPAGAGLKPKLLTEAKKVVAAE
jgi:hypothetical protein